MTLLFCMGDNAVLGVGIVLPKRWNRKDSEDDPAGSPQAGSSRKWHALFLVFLPGEPGLVCLHFYFHMLP